MAHIRGDASVLAFLAPRFWPTWLGLGLLRLATLLPWRVQVSLGIRLGRLAMRVAGKRCHIVRTNLRLCFPELHDAAREKLLRENFEFTGIAIFETAMSWWASDRRLASLAHIEGLDYLTDALAQGTGVILLSAHMTCLEIGGRLLAPHQPFQVIYKQAHNPLFEHIMQSSRRRHFQDAIQTYDTRQVIRALKKNRVTWYAMDQDFGRHRQSLFVSFLGVTASTLTTVSRLAKISGAVVVPYFPYRLPGNQGYRLVIQPAMENFPTDDERQDTQRINDLIGEAVRVAPAQYFWAHRRFKTQPEHGVDLYANRGET